VQATIKKFVRRHFQKLVVFSDGTRLCAAYNESLYNMKGIHHKSLDHHLKNQLLFSNGGHNVDRQFFLH
jgi:hypothetical protein